MRVTELLGHANGVISSVGLAYVVFLVLRLDAPFFVFLDPHIRIGFLIGFLMAAAASTLGSRWWLTLLALWLLPALFAAVAFAVEERAHAHARIHYDSSAIACEL